MTVGHRGRRGRCRRVGAAILVALTVAVIATGCASMRGGVEGDLGRAAGQIASAAISAQLSMQTYAAGRTTSAATDTALGDMLREVDQATAAASDRQVDNPDQVALRSEVTQASSGVTDAIVACRDVVAGIGPKEQAQHLADTLGALGAQLHSVGQRLGTG